MCQTGNPNQWRDKDPAPDLLIQDIRMKQLYLLEDGESIQAVFALIPGTDPTYSYIEGAWINDLPYAAIHRVASAGRRTGVLKECLAFCQKEYRNIRVDTHQDNLIMQHLLSKYGFQRCGIIYLENGDSRIAYQFSR